MSRASSDELADDGTILNGYDYKLQTWVVDGIVDHVGNCPQHVGKPVRDVPGHEIRSVRPVRKVEGICQICGAVGQHLSWEQICLDCNNQ